MVWTGAGSFADAGAIGVAFVFVVGEACFVALEGSLELTDPGADRSTSAAATTSGGPFHSGCGLRSRSVARREGEDACRPAVAVSRCSRSGSGSTASSFIRLNRETRFSRSGAAVAVVEPLGPGGTGFRNGFSTTVSRIGLTKGSFAPAPAAAPAAAPPPVAAAAAGGGGR